MLSRQPNEVDGGGRGVYCCIPLCGNATYDLFMIKTEIGFFKFPDEKRYPVLIRRGFRPSNNFVGKEVTTRFKLSRQQRFASFILNQRKLRCRWELEEKTFSLEPFLRFLNFEGVHHPRSEIADKESSKHSNRGEQWIRIRRGSRLSGERWNWKW